MGFLMMRRALIDPTAAIYSFERGVLYKNSILFARLDMVGIHRGV